MVPPKMRVGIVGYGKLGHFLAHAILEDDKVAAQAEIAFVWNRSAAALAEDEVLPASTHLADLADFESRGATLIVEVAHPSISRDWGARFLENADYMVGSPTALADPALEAVMREAAASNGGNHGLFIPSGALWGAQDILKMAQRGLLASLSVTMRWDPASLKTVSGAVAEGRDRAIASAAAGDLAPVTIFDGSVREISPLAPNNVNTMAAAALAATSLGFDGTRAVLIGDTTLDAHVIEVVAVGHPRPSGDCFRVTSTRHNPAAKGAVTGSATYISFVSSMVLAGGRGRGVHFC